MNRDIDDPARRDAEGDYVGSESSRIARPKSIGEELVNLQGKLDKDSKKLERRNSATAETIRNIVSKRVPRIVGLDSDLFPEFPVIGEDGMKSTMKLLEVPGSGRANGLPFEFLSRRFTVLVAFITEDGKIIDLIATLRQKGKRIIFGGIEPHKTSSENVVNFRDGIFEVLNKAVDKGISTPKNYR